VEGQAVVLCTLQLVVQDIDDIGPVIPGLHAVLDFFEVARPELARAHLRGRCVARCALHGKGLHALARGDLWGLERVLRHRFVIAVHFLGPAVVNPRQKLAVLREAQRR